MTEQRAAHAQRSGHYAEAAAQWQHAAETARALGRDGAVARSLVQLAEVEEDSGLYREALGHAAQGLAISQRLGDGAVEAAALNSLGRISRRLGEYSQALAHLDKARAVAAALGDRGLQSEGHRNTGAVYQERGDYALAKRHHEQSLALARQAGDRAREAKSLNDLGGLHRLRAGYDQARRYYEQSLALRQAAHDEAGAGTVLGNLCLLYQNLRDFDRALDYCRRSLEAAGSTGDRALEANALNNIGGAYRAQGRYREALSYYERSAKLKRALPDRAGAARTLNNIGELYRQTGRPRDAITPLTASLKLKEDIGDRPGESAAQYNLGMVYLQLGDYPQARERFEQALVLQGSGGQPELVWRALDGLSRVFAAQASPALAILFGKQAVNTIQSVRAGMQGMEKGLQRSFLRDKQQVYRRLADLLIDQGRLLEAEQVLAMLKEEEYFDFVRRDAAADVRRSSGYNAREQPWKERYQRIASQIVKLGEDYHALKSKDEAALSADDRKQLQKLEADLDAATHAFTAMLDEMKVAFDKLDAAHDELIKHHRDELVKRQFDVARMGMVGELGAGVVLLQYIVLEDGLRILLTTGDVQKPYKLAIGEKDINRAVEALRDALLHPALDPRPAAKTLYNALIAPVTEDLKQVHAKTLTLMVSLDGLLRYIPIAALYDGTHYLAEQYAVSVYTEAATDRMKDRPRPSWKIAGLGVTQAHPPFSALDGVKAELEGIVRLKGQSTGVLDGVIYLDQDFTQERLRRSLSPTYPVLHVASHFKLSPTDADSFLLLGDGAHLSLAQIRKGRYDFQYVDLLTLSACETALGGNGQGREVEGLAVTAQNKGAKGVLATLWPVADKTTAALMQRIYTLRETDKLSKAEALHRAQLELMQGRLSVPPPNKEATDDRGEVLRHLPSTQAPAYVPDPHAPYAHPYYWAPFVLMGNWL